MVVRLITQNNTQNEKENTNHQSDRLPDFSRCKRSVAFYRVFPVVLNITIVVYNIDTGSKKAECKKALQQPWNTGRDKKLSRKKGWYD